jgi:hypothetical protein
MPDRFEVRAGQPDIAQGSLVEITQDLPLPHIPLPRQQRRREAAEQISLHCRCAKRAARRTEQNKPGHGSISHSLQVAGDAAGASEMRLARNSRKRCYIGLSPS